MRVHLTELSGGLTAALSERLIADGHELTDASESDALVVGLGRTAATGRVLDITVDQWADAVRRTRVAFAAARDVAARIRQRDGGGRIVFVIDPTSVRPVGGAVLSSVPGAFLITLAQVAAIELGPFGVNVNVLVAGWTEEALPGLADGSVLGRPARASEIAGACAFLLSDDASYVTGTTLLAEGGYCITKTSGNSPMLANDA